MQASLISAKSFLIRHKTLIVLFLSVKLLLFLWVVSARGLIPFSQFDYENNGYHFELQPDGLKRALSAYDGQLYLELADSSYTGAPSPDPGQRIFAFFPLFPLLMRVLAPFFGGSAFLAGIAVNLLCSFLACYFLYKLALLDYDESVAIRSVYFFLIFPAAIFFVAIYTEALFLFLSLACLFYCRKGLWWWAGICGYLAALTRPQGILLGAPFFLEYFSAARAQYGNSFGKFLRESRGSFAAMLLIPLGLFSFFLYSYQTTGNFFLPLEAQQSWGRNPPEIGRALDTLALHVSQFFNLPFHSFRESKLDTATALAFISMIFLMPKQGIRASYIAYACCCVVMPLASGSTMSLMRYLSISFPHYILLGVLGAKYSLFLKLTSVAFISLGLWLALRYSNWYWAG